MADAGRPRNGRRALSTNTNLSTAESTFHCIEVLGCVFSATSALVKRDAATAAWSLSALLTSAAALFLLHGRRNLHRHAPLRNCLYAVMRLHRAWAIVGMRRVTLAPTLPPLPRGTGGATADRVYFAKAVLVNSSILPILLQALVLPLPLALQAAVQVAVAFIVIRAMPGFCASLAAGGVQQAQFGWLARLQGRISAVVMAATTGSRGSVAYEAVPCTALLSHLVLCFEVVVPVLFVFFVEKKASATWLGGADGRRANGSASTGSPSSAAGAGSGARSSGARSSGSCSASGRSPMRQLAATWPPAADGADDVGDAVAAAAQRLDAQRSQPSALLMLMLALGLSGVLFDVVLTYSSRMAAQ